MGPARADRRARKLDPGRSRLIKRPGLGSAQRRRVAAGVARTGSGPFPERLSCENGLPVHPGRECHEHSQGHNRPTVIVMPVSPRRRSCS